MRILHISHGKIPDTRVERNAEIMRNRDHELIFLGRSMTGDFLGPFSEKHSAYYGTELLMTFARLQWVKKIRQIDPDIIHAHDIIAVRMTFGLQLPVVYDDHEWWTRNFPIWFNMRNAIRKVFSLSMLLQIPAWERRAITEYPVLTVSDPVAQSHRKEYGGWVRTTFNYPSLSEVSDIEPHNGIRKGFVYLGTDVVPRRGAKSFAPYRNMVGLPSSVEFDKIHGLEYKELLTRLRQYKAGLIPWNCHALHHYCCPAKAFDYLHSGLQVVSPRTMSLLWGNPYVHFFDNLDEIPKILEEMEDVDPDEIIEYARKNYVWEAQWPLIRDAYVEACDRAWSE